MAKRNRPTAPKRAKEAPSVEAIPIDGATIYRSVGENIVIGPCAYAMKILPNGQPLLLFKTEEFTGTYLMGEEVCGFDVYPIKQPVAPVAEAEE